MCKMERRCGRLSGRTISFSARELSEATRLLRLITESEKSQSSDDYEVFEKRDATAICSPGEEEPWLNVAESVFRARTLRLRHFPASLFGEPAWDMLLGLLIIAARNRVETVSGLAHLVGHPLSTSLR